MAEKDNATVEDQTKKEEDTSFEDTIKWVAKELGLPTEKATTLVKNVDQNQDRKISQDELDIMKKIVLEIKERLMKRFEEFDPEKEGFVSKENAKTILEEELKDLPETTINNMVGRYDADKNGKFDFGEFIIFYSYARAKKEDVEKRFKELDLDNSKSLSVDELADILQQSLCLDSMTAYGLLRDMGVDEDEGSSMNIGDFKEHWTKLCL